MPAVQSNLSMNVASRGQRPGNQTLLQFFDAAVFIGAVLAVLMVGAVAPVHSQEIFAYPTKGQSTEQQKQDRYECHVWASEQSGYDPTKGPPPAQTAPVAPASVPTPAPAPPPQGGLVRGAARGAAVGAVGGAIAGDAGEGAAIGAATGALLGGMRRRDQRREQAHYQAQREQAQAQAAAQAPAPSSGPVDAYRRAISACLQARGYTVS